ncbi:MAG: exo-alpha-sialidase [Pyrinomonadaceae bacterium]
MKKLLFLVLTIICSLLTVHPQWQPDVRLTNDPARSFTSGSNSAWCIAASANVVHVVWFDERDGNWEIYYKRSTDGGVIWSADTRLTNNAAGSFSTSITASGSVVHVVWHDNRDGNDEIYYKRSIDEGVSWETDTRLTNNAAQSRFPSVTVSGSAVHVVWRDDRDGNREIYSKRSTDGGVSWETDTRLSNNAALSEYPSVTVSGSVVHVVWYDNRDGNDEIYYKRSTDGGVSWETDTRLTNNAAASQLTSVTVSGSVVHVVWVDFRDGDREIYYKRSPDAGVSWGADTRLTNYAGGSWTPSIAASGSVVHVVWWDQRDGNPEIYFKPSTDGGVSWGADTRLTNSSANSWNPSVAVSGSVVHVVWEDHRDGNSEIYYKRDPTGSPPVTNVTVSGRVTTPDGRGVRNAIVSITDSLGVVRSVTTSSFGFYSFDEVRTGETHTIRVSSKRYRFAARVVQLVGELSEVNFVAAE